MIVTNLVRHLDPLRVVHHHSYSSSIEAVDVALQVNTAS